MSLCAQPDITQPITERLAGYLDCQSQSLAQTGFANLSGGWLGPALLGGCLTIYIALIGYRLILGSPFVARDAVLAALRAGVVIAIATSWPAYETTVYRIVIDGPAELAAQLLPDGLASATLSDAAKRLDDDYQTLVGGPQGAAALTDQTAGAQTAGSAPQRAMLPNGSPQTLPGAASAAPGHGPLPFNSPGLLIVFFSIGSLGAARLAAGLLLGLGPLFVVLGLFDATLGLLEGWARALFGALVATTGCLVVTALQLGFIESQLEQIGVDPSRPVLGNGDLMVTALLFSAVTVVVLVLAIVVGFSFRILPPSLRRGASASERQAAAPSRSGDALVPALDAGLSDPAQRAQSVADAVRRLGRREAATGFGGPSGLSPAPIQVFSGRPAAATEARSIGGEAGSLSYRRRSSPPRTPSAETRNRLQ